MLRLVLLSVLFAIAGLSRGAPQDTDEPSLKELVNECIGKEVIGEVHFQIARSCQQYTCINKMEGRTKKATVKSKGCPIYNLHPGCYVTEVDRSQMYPDCCPQLKCDWK